MFRFILLVLITCSVNFFTPSVHCKQKAIVQSIKMPKKSALVIDCSTNNPIVLYDQSSNEIRHPASLTKIMTVYLLLEAIQNKKVTFNTKFKVSKLASQQMPSKLNLKIGDTISVLDCIKSLLVKSANDVAVVVAEGLAGSVPAFCKLMNKKAKSLGMKHTHYENPSGVPNKKQVTCANDIAILGLSLMNKFSKYWHLFSIKNFTYKNKKYNTHCKILNWYNGADGAKTGYICASGYNLWVTATKFNKDGKSKRLCAIIFGERSGKERDFKAARLLDNYFNDYTLVNYNNKNNINSDKKLSITNRNVNNTNNDSLTNNKTVSIANKMHNNISKNKKITNNNKEIEQEIVVYELESFPMDDVIKSSGKSKEYFDDLYKDDVPLQVESSTPIDFSSVNKSKSSTITNKFKKKLNNKQKKQISKNKKGTMVIKHVKSNNKQ